MIEKVRTIHRLRSFLTNLVDAVKRLAIRFSLSEAQNTLDKRNLFSVNSS